MLLSIDMFYIVHIIYYHYIHIKKPKKMFNQKINIGNYVKLII